LISISKRKSWILRTVCYNIVIAVLLCGCLSIPKQQTTDRIVNVPDPSMSVGIAENAYEIARVQLYLILHMPEEEKASLGTQYDSERNRLIDLVSKRKSDLEKIQKEFSGG
jgi:hypothetical protein